MRLIIKVTAILILVFPLYASEMRYSLEFSPNDISFNYLEAGVAVGMKGCQILGEVGTPALPAKSINLIVPPKSLLGIEYTVLSDTLEGRFDLAPIGNLRPDMSAWEPQKATYKSEAYPDTVVKIAGSGYLSGNHIVSLIIYPVSYLPVTGTLILNRRIDITLRFGQEEQVFVPRVMTPVSALFRKKLLLSLVDNPEDIPRFSVCYNIQEYTQVISGRQESFPPTPGDDPVDLIILTTDSLAPVFSQFDGIKYGSFSRTITVEEIDENYFGLDLPEKIRRFMQDAYRIWGASCLFIGGDPTFVPMRYGYARDAVSSYVDVPTDLYYTCLDGNWNSNGDYHFGESVEDDPYPELSVGRVSAEDISEATLYLAKYRTFSLEDRLLADSSEQFYTDWLLAGAALSNGCTDCIGAFFLDSMVITSPPPEDVRFTRLFSRPEECSTFEADELNYLNFDRELNRGHQILFHVGHSSQYFIGTGFKCGGGGFFSSDFDTLTNSPFYPVLVSFSCTVNAVDFDCISEHWLFAPAGGGVAFIGNTRTAWTHHKGTLERFYRMIARHGMNCLGDIMGGVYVYAAGFDRYLLFITHLEGYPLLRLFTAPPIFPVVEVEPDSISLSDTFVTVSVNDTTGSPIDSATVSCFTPDGRSAIGFTDETGRISFRFSFGRSETLFVWVTGDNIAPVAETVFVSPPSAAHLVIYPDTPVELTGDSDSTYEPGENILFPFWVENTGRETTTATVSIASSPHFTHTPDDTTVVIPATDSVYLDIFSLLLSDTLKGSRVLPVLVELTGEHTVQETLHLRVDTPDMQTLRILWNDADGDNMVEPLDEAQLTAELKNLGTGDFPGGYMVFIPGSLLTVAEDSMPVGEVSHLDEVSISFDLSVSASYDGGGIPFSLSLVDSFGNEKLFNCLLVIPLPPETLLMENGVDWIKVNWSASDSNAYAFNVYRSEELDGEYVRVNDYPIAGISSFLDSPLERGSGFFYRVSSLSHDLVEGALSDAIFAWTSLATYPGWPIRIGGGDKFATTPFFGDIDGDGIDEMFAGSIKGLVYGFHLSGEEVIDRNPATINPFAEIAIETLATEGIWSSGVVEDFDEDGQSEITVASRDIDWNVYMWEIDGTDTPGWPSHMIGPALTNIVASDIDGDGYTEIIVANEYRRFYIWRWNGELYSELFPESPGMFAYTYLDNYGVNYGTPAVADINGDGVKEIIFPGNRNDSTNTGHIYCWDIEGNEPDGFPIEIEADYPASSISLGDIDGDLSTFEIIFSSYHQKVYAYSSTGELLPGFPYLFPMPSAGTYGYTSTPICADVNNDGRDEIIVVGCSQLIVLNGSAETLLSIPLPLPATEVIPVEPAVADINGDGVQDILFFLRERLYAYSSDDGELVVGYPLLMNDLSLGTPVVSDLDNDGYLEIAASAFDGALYLWRTESEAYDGAILWGTARGNRYHTGISIDHFTGIQKRGASPERLSIRLIPNPFNSTQKIILAGNDSERIKLSAYNILGEEVAEIFNGYTMGNEIVWDAGSLPSGIYLILLEKGNRRTLEKTVLIR
ncbi:VCBS repeat-containing protein [bacterium]|nr:VCBS repeat-containing protein [bacterium]